MIVSLPLVIAVAACLALATPWVSSRADLLVTRVALSFFGEYVAEHGRRQR